MDGEYLTGAADDVALDELAGACHALRLDGLVVGPAGAVFTVDAVYPPGFTSVTMISLEIAATFRGPACVSLAEP
ncbi:hypothetical protein Ate02nite_85130 [Paractinoplanes tereljensis]|uniref:Uncharacterized protein n=1 Tax=Paractinoplanes tereljensis TaxID=571912 RepID=A0A919NWS9_9ACTN|nr:hypothetical protein Ate02nite_85130 [Actinoplanes tereljensis]